MPSLSVSGSRRQPTGKIKGLRYYRDAANTGTHTGKLWNADGTELASLTFDDSGTGWQSADFSSPVSITAGTTYVASYYAPNGHYSANVGGIRQPDGEHAAELGSGSGGYYCYGNGFPDRDVPGHQLLRRRPVHPAG